MNKSQLISAVAEATSVPKSDVKRVFDSLFALTEQKLNENEKVVISGFGVFSTAQVSERTGRNPRTGEKVRIAARRMVRFRSNMEIK
ncbi:MAG: HU family DNA-binding protein [Alistipes sp.]|nr:HU family DNA-binding protein [Alistipes sp.]